MSLKQTREAVRSDFPALKRTVNGHPAAFLDGPGGTQVPQQVIDAVVDSLANHNSNSGGVFPLSEESDAALWGAREAAADFVGGSPEEIVFGANMTTLTLAFSRTLSRQWGPGDEIVVTDLDHQANVAPWVRAAEDAGATVRRVPFDPETVTLDYSALAEMICERTRLVAIGYASNATGTVNEVRDVCRRAREFGALSYVDAVHYAPHGAIDVKAIGCDFLTCSAYKFFGPHVGIVWGRAEALASCPTYKLPPVSDEIPSRWESGTLNHEGIVGAGAAIDWIAALGDDGSEESRRKRIVDGMGAIHALERPLLDRLLTELPEIPGVQIVGPPAVEMRTPTVSFRMEGHSPQEIARTLGNDGIFVWDGDFYASSVIDRLGLREEGGLVRIGLAPYNTEDEIDRLIAALEGIAGRR